MVFRKGFPDIIRFCLSALFFRGQAGKSFFAQKTGLFLIKEVGMRINSATIGMESERTYSRTSTRVSGLTRLSGRQSIMDGSGTLFGGFLQTDSENAEQSKDRTGIGNQNLADIQGRMTSSRLNSQSISDMDDLREQMRKLRESCLNYLMQILFPDKYKAGDYEATEETTKEQQPQATTLLPQLATVERVSYMKRYYFEESESTSFTTKGTVKTEDGREIDFNLNLNMSRSFMEYYEEEIDFEQLTLCDPLVINLEGNAAQVSDQTFFFDIDCDGVEDEISRLISGSGFLALDKNGDGMINDGSELFGTQSGNGFADLAKYDSDGNGFIDENDEIFDKLKIWCMDENGQPHLYSLKEKGVGAIGLMHSGTQYSLTNENNETNAVIRSTGFFLFEDGNAGTVQHVDLAKHEQAV